eukprot:gene3963-4602_t
MGAVGWADGADAAADARLTFPGNAARLPGARRALDDA